MTDEPADDEREVPRGLPAFPAERPKIDRKLTAADKRRYALMLRRAGAPYDEIARLVGWKSKASAYEAVHKALLAHEADDVEAVRALELERLDAMLASGTFERAMTGDQDAIGTVLAIMRHRLRLVPGLEVTPRTELTGAGGAPLTVVFGLPEQEFAEPVAEADLPSLADGAIDTTGAPGE